MWFGKFNQVVEEFGMQKSKSDHFIFYKNSSSGIILLVVYVDDIIITESDSKDISSLFSKPITHKGLRDAKILLGH